MILAEETEVIPAEPVVVVIKAIRAVDKVATDKVETATKVVTRAETKVVASKATVKDVNQEMIAVIAAAVRAERPATVMQARETK